MSAASEMVAIGARIEEMERPKAEARMLSTLKRGADLPLESTEPSGEPRRRTAEARWDGVESADSTPSKQRNPRTADVVAEALGTSGPTYRRMKSVVTAANNENRN